VIKKIATKELKPGMYIHDFKCGWLENPFFSNQMMLKNDGMIEKIVKQGIREVYIDTTKGLNAAEAVTEYEVKKEINAGIHKIAKEEKTSAGMEDRVSFREEIKNALEIKVRVKQEIYNVMQDVKYGKQVNMGNVNEVVGEMVESVFNNKHALTTLCRVKDKDEYTFLHSISVCTLMVAFCKTLGFDRDTIAQVGTGALLHDIGKMKIPDEILNKNGKLTGSEYNIIKRHVLHGRAILKETPEIHKSSMEILEHHHERYDGTGYPSGLKGENISKLGQMAAVVDVYDAITSDRVYHKRVEPAEVLKSIYEWSQYHFNREVVQNFIRYVGIFPAGSLVRTKSGYLGVVTEQSTIGPLYPKIRLVFEIEKNGFIEPMDINLIKPENIQHKILNAESPEKWRINPFRYLDLIGADF